MRLHFYLIFALPVSLLFEDTLDRFTFVGPLLKAFGPRHFAFEPVHRCSFGHLVWFLWAFYLWHNVRRLQYRILWHRLDSAGKIFQHTVPRCCQCDWQWNPIMFLIERQSISVSESRLIFSDKFRLNLHPMCYRSYIFLPSMTYGFTLPQGDNRWGCAMDVSLGHVPAKCPLFTRVSTTKGGFYFSLPHSQYFFPSFDNRSA